MFIKIQTQALYINYYLVACKPLIRETRSWTVCNQNTATCNNRVYQRKLTHFFAKFDAFECSPKTFLVTRVNIVSTHYSSLKMCQIFHQKIFSVTITWWGGGVKFQIDFRGGLLYNNLTIFW